MKSFVAVVFAGWILAGGLLPGFSIDQSVHLGDLVQHFQEHRKENTNLTFVSFLDMHYGANSNHQKHPKHNHNKLPARGHVTHVYLPITVRLAELPLVQILTIAQAADFVWENFYSFQAVFSLINPPRA